MTPVKKAIAAVLGLSLFLVASPLYLIQHLWQHMTLQPVSLSIVKEAWATVLITLEEALQTLMPKANRFSQEIKTLSEAQREALEAGAGITLDPQYEREFHFFVGKKDGEILGYAAADTVAGKWGPIHYLALFDLQGTVQDVLVVQYEEKRGKPVAERRFLKQFFGKTKKDEIALMKDIRGVTGASISSRGMTDGIRKLVHAFQIFYGSSNQ